LNLLIQFCVEDYTVEKIFFWLDVEQFKIVTGWMASLKCEKKSKKEELKREKKKAGYALSNPNRNHLVTEDEVLLGYAKSIHRKYIQADAEMNLHLAEPIKSGIEHSLGISPLDRNLFSEAQQAVYQELENDIFPRFFYSFAGKKYLAKVLEEEKRGTSRVSLSGVIKLTPESFRQRKEKNGDEAPPISRIRRLLWLASLSSLAPNLKTPTKQQHQRSRRKHQDRYHQFREKIWERKVLRDTPSFYSSKRKKERKFPSMTRFTRSK